MLTSRWRLPLVLILVLAVLAALLIRQRTPGEAVAATPDDELLRSVLAIDADRTGFAYVPAQRPPGLLSMGAAGYSTDTGATIAAYHLQAGRLDGYVALTSTAVPACALWSAGSCARAERVEVAGVDQPLFVGITVQPRGPEPSATDADIAALKRYWAGVAFVPLDRAAWFQDLLAAARQA